MWRNRDVEKFIAWLHEHNRKIPAIEQRIGFYGIDLYSLFTSIEAVVSYLDQQDPDAAARARQRYECFDHFDRDSQAYGMQTSLGMRPDCEDAVIDQLVELRRSANQFLQRDGVVARDELFFAEQNARVVTNAEKYYRSMFRSYDNSWNIRDRHMAETVEGLANHLRSDGQDPRIVVWAHNSHLGDARATDQAARGELNLGQLLREAHEGDTISIGFSTYTGSVTAALNWDRPAEHKRVRPGLSGSYEELFHQVGEPNFFIRTSDATDLKRPRLQRAIGVIYRPETERLSHYYEAQLSKQFDWLIHYDRTRALEPLEKGPGWQPGPGEDVPEAYPSGL
jgi:erythromycin esterase-like protein